MTAAEQQEALECIECLEGVVTDVLPQMGKIVLQDYARLNRGLILSRKILSRASVNRERIVGTWRADKERN